MIWPIANSIHMSSAPKSGLASGKVSSKKRVAAVWRAGSSFLLPDPALPQLVYGLSVVALFLAAAYPFTKRFAVRRPWKKTAFGFKHADGLRGAARGHARRGVVAIAG